MGPHRPIGRTDTEVESFERRRWDLNPRLVAQHTISSRADSAALALLRDCSLVRLTAPPYPVGPFRAQILATARLWGYLDVAWRSYDVHLSGTAPALGPVPTSPVGDSVRHSAKSPSSRCWPTSARWLGYRRRGSGPIPSGQTPPAPSPGWRQR